jgi:Uncharacterised nucleotidyltransferase
VIKADPLVQDLLDCLTGKVKQPRDWRSLVALAATTLTVGSLADSMLAPSANVEVPPDFIDLLVDLRARSHSRNRRMRHQFLELLPALNAIGVEPVAMKGLARLLSEREEQSRIVADLDLLVPAASRGHCIRALQLLGYEMIGGADEGGSPVLARAVDVATIDLHTSIKPLYLKLCYDDAARHCRRLDLADGAALLPSPTFQMLLIVTHDQLNDRDYWRGLIDVRHLVDAHRLAREGVDWALLASFFGNATSKRAFEVHMATARSLMTIDIPEEYCGGAWARFQLLRRKLQTRVPIARPFFTLLTMALDPPRGSSEETVTAPSETRTPLRRLGRRLERYLWLSYPGKLG